MEISCPNCGAENWLENQSRCFHCDAVLRRCIDCANYDRTYQKCRSLETEVELPEAENPTLLSVSTNCPGYRCLKRTV